MTVTAGFVFGLPVGITFMASAWSEPTLIKIASGFEAAANVLSRPRFRRTFRPDQDPRAAAAAAKSASSQLLQKAGTPAQRYAARLDPFLVPRLRRLPYL